MTLTSADSGLRTVIRVDEKPTSLIVMRDPITSGRISMVMKQRNWLGKVLNNGMEGIQFYEKNRPRLVFVGYDSGEMSGEETALRIKEIDHQARIIVVGSRAKAPLMQEISISVGAVAVLTTPVVSSDIEKMWPRIMGVVPPAPGLSTLEPLPISLPSQNDPPGHLPPPPAPILPAAEGRPQDSSMAADSKQQHQTKRKFRKSLIIVFLVLAAISSSLTYYLLT